MIITKINQIFAKEDDGLEQKEINDWRDRVNKKGLRFLVRDDIEEIIKDKDIDRKHFHEFSKVDFEKIIRKFYFTFSDIKNYSTSVTLFHNSMHYRSDLKYECIDSFFRTNDWCEYMKTIKNAVPNNSPKLFLILCEGWVYEGEIDEMFTILDEVTYIEDFYIVSPKFDWFIAVSDMEDNAFIYKL